MQPGSALDSDDLVSVERLRDPFLWFAQLRREDPVHWNARFGVWLLTRYSDVKNALQNTETFGSSDGESWVALAQNFSGEDREIAVRALSFVTDLIVRTDGPAHSRQRAALSMAFRAQPIESTQQAAQEHARVLLREAEAADRCDLVRQFSDPLASGVVFSLLGIPNECRPLARLAVRAHHRFLISLSNGDRSGLRESAADLEQERAMLAALIADRRRHASMDFIGILARAQDRGETFTDDELVVLIHSLLLAGQDTASSLISLGTLELLRTRNRWESLRAEPTLLPNAVKELLRYVSPVLALPRMMRRDFCLHDQRLREGDKVLLGLGAANRDPAVFQEPDTIDFRRLQVNSLSFGHGAHFCVGSALATIEAQVAFSVLLERFPDLTLAPGQAEFHPIFVLRRLKELTVQLSTASNPTNGATG